MSEIVFGQSYYLRFDPKLWEAMQPYPPLGSLYAAALLRREGYQVSLFDAMLASCEEEWAEFLDCQKPRIAILYEDNFNYLSKMCLLRMRQAAFAMIEMAVTRNCVVILCGADATDHAEEYLAHGADYVLLGEGELTMLELVGALTGRLSVPLAHIRGLAYAPSPSRGLPARAEERNSAPREVDHGERPTVRTPRRPDIRDLDALPYPAWDLIDVERYRAIWVRRHGYFSMNMVTTRGCPYHCNWCAKPIWGQRYNSHSPEHVAAELKWLKDTYRPDHIWFMDDILGLKPGWLEQFAGRVQQLDCRIPFKCLSRVDLLLRSGEIDHLKAAGCQAVWVGAESGSQKILDAMEKGTRVEQIHEAARRLRDRVIQVGFFLQFGYPGETREDIEQTLAMVRASQPDEIGMSVSYPLPGTRFHATVQQRLGRKQNWQDSADMSMLYEGPYGTAFYRQLHTVLHREFRARKHLRELGQLLRRPLRLRPRHLRQLAVAVYYTLTLPLERHRLDQRARRAQPAAGFLHAPLSNAQAAVPTAQAES
jgi:anaerobic magnesium-protoporphyrin IX monomethyl ester cyclase